MHTIFHLDMDAFFVSVERNLDPSLEGKPVIVGGNPINGRGVVAACSYEAREYGLHSAMPIRQAYRLCPHGEYIRGHGTEYGRYSKEVKAILEKYFPAIEQASVDEFYLDFTGCELIYGPPAEFAKKVQKEIWDTLHLPCSIGVSANKTVSKIASDYRKPRGITIIPHGMEKEFLSDLPIEKMPGIGNATLPHLLARGFITIGDIAKTSPEYLSVLMGKHGLSLWEKANGNGSVYFASEHERKSISKETTFRDDLIDSGEIESVIFRLVGKICQLLRNENWQASTISIKLRYSDFVTLTRAKTVRPTDDDKIVFDTAVELFRKTYTRRVGVRLIGVHLSKLDHFAEQEPLFNDEGVTRKKMLRAVMKIRDKFGFDVIHVGKN